MQNDDFIGALLQTELTAGRMHGVWKEMGVFMKVDMWNKDKGEIIPRLIW